MTIVALCAGSLLLVGPAACSQPAPIDVHPAEATSGPDAGMVQATQSGAVANLPFAVGRSFASLEEYLEFRKSRGAYDVPWYREIKPGLYELVSLRGPGAKPQIHTREDLARKFGFAE